MRKIVIAPYQMHKNLLKMYRQKDSFVDVKIISKEDLMGQYYGKIRDEALPYLLKNSKYSYDNLISLIPFLPYIDKPINDFFDIKNDLISNHLIVKNDYLKQFFLNNEVEIVGYSNNDRQLKTVLDALSVNYKFVHNNERNIKENILLFETQFDEIFFALNSIAELIKQGQDINKIYLYITNDEYKYSIDEFSRDFGFQVDDGKSYPLYITPIAKQFVERFTSSKDLIAAKESVSNSEDKEVLEDLLAVIEQCADDKMDFKTQLEYLIGELKTTNVSRKRYDNVVRIINRPIYDEGAHIFVLGFCQGSYPKSRKDNELISDKDKVTMGLNTTLEETQINQDELLDFFYSNNHFHFSFAARSIKDQYFLSPLVKKLNLNKVPGEFPTTLYSKNMADFYYAKLRDLKEFYSETSPEFFALGKVTDIPYGKYDNSFSGVNALSQDVEMSLSYSGVNDYFQCPFKYYVGKVLNIDPFEGNYYTKLGHVVHKVFELHNNEDFDFDEVFNKQVEEEQFLDEEIPLIMNLKDKIKRASDAIKLHQKYMDNPKIATEEKLRMTIGKKSHLSGVIDKIITFDDKYMVIVDYKTGDDSFNPKFINEGLSLQLPTYCLLTMSNDKYKNYEIIGTFINNVINPKLTYGLESEEDLIETCYRLNGQVISDIDLIAKIDDTIRVGNSKFIKNVGKKVDGTLKKSDSLTSPSEFKNYGEVALRKYLEADSAIRNNAFEINPLYRTKSVYACDRCQFKDICYVKKSQRRYLYQPSKEEMEGEDNE